MEEVVTCRNCKYYHENFMTSARGEGLYRFGYCDFTIYDLKLVDPDAMRYCEHFASVV